MSAPYHTQSCNGSTQCRCIEDHLKWADELDTPTPLEQVLGLLIVGFLLVCTVITVCGALGYTLVMYGAAIAKLFN